MDERWLWIEIEEEAIGLLDMKKRRSNFMTIDV